MIKKIAWDAFKNTGDINTFLEFKEIENVENQIKIEKDFKDNGECKDKGNNFIGT